MSCKLNKIFFQRLGLFTCCIVSVSMCLSCSRVVGLRCDGQGLRRMMIPDGLDTCLGFIYCSITNLSEKLCCHAKFAEYVLSIFGFILYGWDFDMRVLIAAG